MDGSMEEREQALAVGRRVLGIEADALNALANALDDRFVEAVDLILKTPGRVIVSGMGKSGHIGHKIAATLASTGTPAFFVHPAEASHGDLGMLTQQDVALVLSNSGETKELADIVAHCKRFQIPLIGVAGKAGSTLLRRADIPLLLPEAPEACSVGMAPTTSTTMTLALGDALTVALMERRAFTRDDFGVFHPGGKLGAQLVAVDGLMATGNALPLVTEDAPMSDALVEMSSKGFGVAGTIDADGMLTGIITDGDLRRSMDGLLDRRAYEVATKDPQTIRPDQLAQEALAIMNERKITCLFVSDRIGAKPLGILHVHDCLRAGVDGV
ncbi:MAG: SIS domain-containing protein [Paracoccaceae bacterium]